MKNIEVKELTTDIPANTKLDFNGVEVITISFTPQGATTLEVESIPSFIPQGTVATYTRRNLKLPYVPLKQMGLMGRGSLNALSYPYSLIGNVENLPPFIGIGITNLISAGRSQIANFSGSGSFQVAQFASVITSLTGTGNFNLQILPPIISTLSLTGIGTISVQAFPPIITNLSILGKGSISVNGFSSSTNAIFTGIGTIMVANSTSIIWNNLDRATWNQIDRTTWNQLN